MTRLAKIAIMLLLIASSIASESARAQVPFDALGNIRVPDTATKFSLSPPGARSLAMGGAYLGLADDATAAYTNPAGLTNLALGGSEVAVEARQTRFTTSFTDRGHYPSFPEFFPGRTLVGEDSIDGLPLSESETETSGLSFLSFGYVLPGGLTLAVYRHELANFRSGFESQGPFNDDQSVTTPLEQVACNLLFTNNINTPFNCDIFRVNPRRTNIDLEIVNYGISAAYGFDLPPLGNLESNLSVGIGLSFYEIAFDGRFETFDVCHVAGFDPVTDNCIPFPDPADPAPAQRAPGAFFGPADFSQDNHVSDLVEKGDDEAFGLSVGFLWKLGRQQRWSIGGVFRQGPDIETTRRSTLGHHPDLPLAAEHALIIFDQPPGQVTVPDVFGLGVAFRTAGGNTKIALDVNRVRYSQTLGDFASGFNRFDLTDPAVMFDPNTRILSGPADPIFLDGLFDVPDVTQIHVGLERTVLVVENLFVGTVRFGAWHEPFHDPVYNPSPPFQVNPDLQALFARPEDDEIHFSGGFGLVIKEDYQIDFAVDFSDPVNTASVSLVKFL